jgi:hypothetical protein
VDKTRRKLQGELKLLQELLADKERTGNWRKNRKLVKPGGNKRVRSSSCLQEIQNHKSQSPNLVR